MAYKSECVVDRRNGNRYRLNATVKFRWSGPEDGQYQGEGVTRDMSVAGAFVFATTCPPPSSVIQVEVFFPLIDSGSKGLMEADMMVLRVEQDVSGNKRSGFSAVGERFSLGSPSEPAVRLVGS